MSRDSPKITETCRINEEDTDLIVPNNSKYVNNPLAKYNALKSRVCQENTIQANIVEIKIVENDSEYGSELVSSYADSDDEDQ